MHVHYLSLVGGGGGTAELFNTKTIITIHFSYIVHQGLNIFSWNYSLLPYCSKIFGHILSLYFILCWNLVQICNSVNELVNSIMVRWSDELDVCKLSEDYNNKVWQGGQNIKQDIPPSWFECWKEVVIKLITPPVFIIFAFFPLSHTQTHTGSLFLPSSFTHSLTHTGWCTSPFFFTWGSEEGQGDTQKQIEMLQWVLSWCDAWLMRCSLALLLHLQVCWSTQIRSSGHDTTAKPFGLIHVTDIGSL